jgi:hypothetical protein
MIAERPSTPAQAPSNSPGQRSQRRFDQERQPGLFLGWPARRDRIRKANLGGSRLAFQKVRVVTTVDYDIDAG